MSCPPDMHIILCCLQQWLITKCEPGTPSSHDDSGADSLVWPEFIYWSSCVRECAEATMLAKHVLHLPTSWLLQLADALPGRHHVIFSELHP